MYPSAAMPEQVAVQLGRTSVTVTQLGLGCAPIGGLYERVSEADAGAVVDRAWERGLRLFDTAPLYGSGLSERRVGAALGDRPRDAFVRLHGVGERVENEVGHGMPFVMGPCAVGGRVMPRCAHR